MLKEGDRFIILGSKNLELLEWYNKRESKVLVADQIDVENKIIKTKENQIVHLGEAQKLYEATCSECSNKFLVCASIAQTDFGILDGGHGKCPKCNTFLNLTFNPELETMDTMSWNKHLELKGIRKVKTFNSIKEVDFSDIKVPGLVIYKNPEDYPDKCIARIWDMSIPAATNTIYIADSVEEIRKIIPSNAVVVPRAENDLATIVETWLL